ncbi:MAG: hypothetical protein WA960_00200 [Tunicatimonas sp.]
MNRSLRTLGPVGCLAFSLLGLTGCLPEDDLSELEIKAPSPSIALPLLNTNLTVSDIITIDEGEGLLTENEDHTYSVLYRSQVASKTAEDVLPAIPDQESSSNFTLGINSPAFQMKSPPQKFTGKMAMDMAGLNVFSLESKGGRLNLTLDSDYQHDLDIKLTFPSVKNRTTGIPLVWNVTINAWSNKVTSQGYELADYSLELVDNEVSYALEVAIQGSGQPISENQQIRLSINMADIKFGYLSGNFAGIDVPIPADTLQIPLLDGAVDGTLGLNPTLRFQFINSFGVKVAANLTNAFVVQEDGKNVQLTDKPESSFFGGGYNLPFKEQRDDSTATQRHVVDESTSNIRTAFAKLPRSFRFGPRFILDNAPEDTSFVTDQSQIEISTEIELPLEGTFDLILQDSIPVDFTNLEDVEELKVLIKTENSFPLSANLRIFFLDEDGQLILNNDQQPLSLFGEEDQLLVAAELIDSSTGKTRPATVDLPITATLDQDKFERIRSATHLLVRTSLNSVSDASNQIKLYSFYNVRFNLATQIKTSLN